MAKLLSETKTFRGKRYYLAATRFDAIKAGQVVEHYKDKGYSAVQVVRPKKLANGKVISVWGIYTKPRVSTLKGKDPRAS